MNLRKTIAAMAIATMTLVPVSYAESPADLSDVEIAHVAYTADNIDIAYAKLALEKSQNESVYHPSNRDAVLSCNSRIVSVPKLN